MKFGEDWSKREPVNFQFDHSVQFWIMSVPKQPPLKMKSGILQSSMYHPMGDLVFHCVVWAASSNKTLSPQQSVNVITNIDELILLTNNEESTIHMQLSSILHKLIPPL